MRKRTNESAPEANIAKQATPKSSEPLVESSKQIEDNTILGIKKRTGLSGKALLKKWVEIKHKNNPTV